MAPQPGTEEFALWAETTWQHLVGEELACTEADDEAYAERLARMKFDAFTHAQPYTGISPKKQPLWRVMKAYAVEKVEPGRIAAVVAARATPPPEPVA